MQSGSRHRHDLQQGFTLLEVLMVVLLVGILSSVVMLSVGAGGAERHLREESDRLATLLEQAAMEAVMQNQEFGLRLADDGYAFLCLNEGKQEWDYCQDSIFRERTLAEGLELRLLKQGDLKEVPRISDESEAPRRDGEEGLRLTPDIFLLSSGEASAASLEIRVQETPELRSEISVDAIGRVQRSVNGDNDTAEAGAGNAG
jgi:general secretion pathway protein H